MKALALLAFLLWASPAAAERLIVGLSTDRIGVTSAFQGTDFAVFAVIAPDEQSANRRGGYDAVVVVRGPARTQVVRRREKLGPIWINGASRSYVAAPSLYLALSNKPIADVALERVREEAQIGLGRLGLVQPWVSDNAAEDATFRQAFVESRRDEELYGEFAGEEHLRFLAPNVLRARVRLPANAPVGAYSVEVFALWDGFLVGRSLATFSIEKIGFEAAVFDASRDRPLLYGMATVALALATGWAAGVLFRRG
jgi:uncharacterized protein (TIGR02186 family)